MASPRRGKRIQHRESLLLGVPRHDDGYPDRQAPGSRQARGAGPAGYPRRCGDLRGYPGPRGRPVRRTMRPGVRGATALAGLVLVMGGAFAVFRALSGSAGPLTGGATTIPSTVRTTPPRVAADTAAALGASAPVRTIIPSLRVDAPVMRLGRAADGSIQVPPLANHNQYLDNIVVYTHLVG